MNAIARVIVASALLLPGGLAAQTFKCKSDTGKVTYSGKKCSDLGLKDAGEVKDRLNVNPAPPTYQPPPQQGSSRETGESRRPSAPAAAAQAPKAPAPVAPPEPAPERRCFVVKTAKGNVTRCNDRPDEE